MLLAFSFALFTSSSRNYLNILVYIPILFSSSFNEALTAEKREELIAKELWVPSNFKQFVRECRARRKL